ncbi:DUF983 domain-containing protein [Nonlabens spongiae]|uniref:DUF983 domain-containing protein n=1 Tax=Nonlabens spongiae TaxID=331648 RepID=A0A1W6MIK0_9FLAO|nr:DUF983 domain-containing protein [Nonlabens spongiae]ARN77397.1 DUF983 domain-containing protein [Nonlabens spongiae]
MKHKSMLVSILTLKCPRCRQGAFLEANPYKLSKMNKVREHCPKCGLKYHIEPSFYTGSMYVSYGVGVAVAVAVFVILAIFDLIDDPLIIFLAILGTLILTFPYIGAVSKSIWAHMFIKFDKDIAEKVKNGDL